MEFKELLAYAKRSWLLILLVSALFALVAYFAADRVPGRDTTARFSSSGEFDLPFDSFRVSGLGAQDSRRIVIDTNTEVASVSSQGNRETAARYYVVLETLVEAIAKSQPATPEGETAKPATAHPDYDAALKQLSRKAENLYDVGGSTASGYYEISVGAMPVNLNSVKAGREAEVRDFGGPDPGTKTTASPVLNSRRVIINVQNASSYDRARMWTDAVLLAAKRESFQRVVSQFDSLIARTADDVSRSKLEIEGERRETLVVLATSRLNALKQQAAQVAHRVRVAGGKVEEDTEATFNPEDVFVQRPEFSTERTNAEKRAYFGFIRKTIEEQYPEVAVAYEQNTTPGRLEDALIGQLRVDMNEQLRRVREAQTSLNLRLVATQRSIELERKRFDQCVEEGRLLEYIPNLGVINSPEMTRTKTDLDNALRERTQKSQLLRDEHAEMSAAHRQVELSLSRWKDSITQGFALAEEKLRTDRLLLESEIQSATSSAAILLEEVAKTEERRNILINHWREYSDAVKETDSVSRLTNDLESKLSNIRLVRSIQAPVIQVSSFSLKANSASALSMGRGNIAIIVFVMCVVASAVMIYIWALSRNRISNEFDVRKHVNLPVLAKFAKREADQVSLLNVNPKSGVAEAFSTLATLVRSYAKELSLRSLLITSAIMEEGKTDISSNLGIALSRKGLRVLVVDADLHRSRVGNFFGATSVSGGRGLVQFVADGGKGQVADYASSIPDGPDVLLPGGTVEDPVKLLESDAFKSLMKQAEREYDFVIYDSPPVTRVGDALILAGEIDATVLVCSSGDVSFADAAMAKRLLTSVQANLLGVVLNNSKDAEAREYYNYYAYGKENRRRVRKVVG